MPKAAPSTVRSATQESSSDARPRQAADFDDDRDQVTDEEPQLRSPQEFFTEVTRRPDVNEILKRLANI